MEAGKYRDFLSSNGSTLSSNGSFSMITCCFMLKNHYCRHTASPCLLLHDLASHLVLHLWSLQSLYLGHLNSRREVNKSYLPSLLEDCTRVRRPCIHCVLCLEGKKAPRSFAMQVLYQQGFPGCLREVSGTPGKGESTPGRSSAREQTRKSHKACVPHSCAPMTVRLSHTQNLNQNRRKNFFFQVINPHT